MDDPATATAKAVEATANAVGKGLEIVHDTGGYLGRVFADVPTDLVGVLGGAWLHERHIRLRDRLRRRTEEILRERNVQELVQLSPNLAAALVAGAQEESRDELMELWARLLANAIDPKMNSVRQSFIDAVKKMDPTDVLVLKFLYTQNQAVLFSDDDAQHLTITKVAIAINRTRDDVEVSARNLLSIGLLDARPSSTAGPPSRWLMNAASRELKRACYPEVKQ